MEDMTYYFWFSIENSNSNRFANEEYCYHNNILKQKNENLQPFVAKMRIMKVIKRQNYDSDTFL